MSVSVATPTAPKCISHAPILSQIEKRLGRVSHCFRSPSPSLTQSCGAAWLVLFVHTPYSLPNLILDDLRRHLDTPAIHPIHVPARRVSEWPPFASIQPQPQAGRCLRKGRARAACRYANHSSYCVRYAVKICLVSPRYSGCCVTVVLFTDFILLQACDSGSPECYFNAYHALLARVCASLTNILCSYSSPSYRAAQRHHLPPRRLRPH